MTNTTNIKTADGWTHLNNLEILNDTYVQGNLTVLGSINGEDQVVTGITAHPGGGQSLATALTLGAFNNITVVASGADSVKIPASAVGATLTVSNQGANAAQIFGTSPDTINGVATGTGISIPVGAIFVFTCAVAGNWLQNVQTGGAFSGTFDGVLGGNTPAAVTATTITATGAIAGGSSSNIAINTNKFTVTASSGNTLVAGTFAVTGSTIHTGLVTNNGGTVTTGLAVDAATAISAAGTTVSDATALTASVNNVTTVGASTAGVKLPACAAGKIIVVNNLGANAMHVYGAGSDTIDGAAAGTGVVLTNTKRAIFVGISAAAWTSLMGIPAA